MIFNTNRLILRPWEETDAESLYKYASQSLIGTAAGWIPHKSIDESLSIIKTVLSHDEDYAICLKEDNLAIGSISLTTGNGSHIKMPENQAELGYWLGFPFWGQSIVPEACFELIRHGFVDLELEAIWCGYFDGNEKSKRVQEKCGFKFHHTDENVLWPVTGQTLTEHITLLTREDYFKAAR